MEVQIQDLIEQIKKDGVEAAANEAENIISSAKTKAEKIISEAQAEADRILENAKAENERMVKSSEDAIRQAGRNLLISFRESISRELGVILNDNVSSVYSSEKMSQLIIKALEELAAKPDSDDLSVILNTENLKSLEETVIAGLKARLLEGVTLKANDNFDGGFRISANGGSAYYDYSAEAVVDMLSDYLSPRVTELLKEVE